MLASHCGLCVHKLAKNRKLRPSSTYTPHMRPAPPFIIDVSFGVIQKYQGDLMDYSYSLLKLIQAIRPPRYAQSSCIRLRTKSGAQSTSLRLVTSSSLCHFAQLDCHLSLGLLFCRNPEGITGHHSSYPDFWQNRHLFQNGGMYVWIRVTIALGPCIYQLVLFASLSAHLGGLGRVSSV